MGLGSAVHERRVLPRYPDRAIGTKTGTDRYRANLSYANLSGAVRRTGISRADLDGATVLDTAMGLVDEGHPGSRGVGDDPYPADRHTRADWLPRCTRSTESLATACLGVAVTLSRRPLPPLTTARVTQQRPAIARMHRASLLGGKSQPLTPNFTRSELVAKAQELGRQLAA